MSSARTGSNSPIHKAMRKHGFDKFVIEEVCTVSTIEELKAKERELITLLNTYGNSQKGYNATRGGDGTWGRVHSELTRMRIRLGQQKARSEGRFLNDEWYQRCLEARQRQIGVPLSEEHKANISKALCGKKKNQLSGKQPKPVSKFDKQGKFIQSFLSMADAAKEMNTDTTSIMRCCQGKRKTVKGFVFRFKERLI